MKDSKNMKASAIHQERDRKDYHANKVKRAALESSEGQPPTQEV